MNTQVGNAVQNTLNTRATTETLLSVDNVPQLAEIANEHLNKEILKQAYKLADDAYDIQWGKDGIEDTQTKLKGLQGKVGEKVYAIAKMAYHHCKSVPGGKALLVARQYFMALCKLAEEHISKRDIEANGRELAIGKLIPLWPQYKSDIAKGMEMGIDPDARNPDTVNEKNPKGTLFYATAAQYRAKVQEEVTRGANGRESDKPKDRKEVVTALNVVTSGWSPQLKAANTAMCEQLSRLPHDLQDKFAARLLAIAGEAKELADKNMSEKKMDADKLASKLAESRGETDKQEDDESELDPDTQAALQAALDKEQAQAAKGPATTGRAAKKGPKVSAA